MEDYFDKPISLKDTASLLRLRISVLKNATLRGDKLPGDVEPPERHALGYRGFYYVGKNVEWCMKELKLI